MLRNDCYSEAAVNEVECISKVTTVRHVITVHRYVTERIHHMTRKSVSDAGVHTSLKASSKHCYSAQTSSSHAVFLPCDMHTSAWVIPSSVRRSFTEWNICRGSSRVCPSVPFHLVLTDLIEDVLLFLSPGFAYSWWGRVGRLWLWTAALWKHNVQHERCCRFVRRRRVLSGVFFGLVRTTSTFVSS